jgi:hypothetical protein
MTIKPTFLMGVLALAALVETSGSGAAAPPELSRYAKAF